MGSQELDANEQLSVHTLLNSFVRGVHFKRGYIQKTFSMILLALKEDF